MNSAITSVTDRGAVLLLLFLLICLSLPLEAQTAAGRIIGTVTDTQGAVIGGAEITVVNTSTGVTQKATSNGQGFYQVLELPVGAYTVTAEHSGFARDVTPAESLDIFSLCESICTCA